MKNKLSDDIFEQLKQQILLNRVRPGDKLSEERIVNEYHVSRTPARQALQRLEALGLVEIRDGVGSFVTMISPQEMHDAYEIRRMAEKTAARTAIERIPPAELERLEEQFQRFAYQLQSGGYGTSYEEMIRADWKLHDLIICNSGNRLLPSAIEQVTLILRRYQFTYITQYQRATVEHLQIIQALRDRDYERLCALLDEHLRLRQM